jgi:hypothetical protein
LIQYREIAMEFDNFYREPIGMSPSEYGDFVDDSASLNGHHNRRHDPFYQEFSELHFPWREMIDWR